MSIHITDVLQPEDNAMLQALYSRSPASVHEHMKKVDASGSGAFMDKFYVQFGHQSIADCGSTTIFVEDVSMLAAKAFQDWALYSGQEASTRYMDFSKVRIEDPLGTTASKAIQDRWMSFYHGAREQLVVHLLKQYPRREGENEKAYEGAIKARAFDVLRAFLPAGASTNFSWHTNLRQAADKLRWMLVHPDPIIAGIAKELTEKLSEKYRHSGFLALNSDAALRDYRAQMMREYAYSDELPPPSMSIQCTDNVDHNELKIYQQAFASRPRKADVPPFLSMLGSVTSQFALDFGSFRDLQRHRNGVVRMPLLTTRHGFHEWYIEQLPLNLQQQAHSLLFDQEVALKALDAPPIVAQYYTAMGFLVACDVTQGLPAFIYRLELRTSKTVHPTLRRVAQAEARWFSNAFSGVPIYADMDQDDWDVRRGTQTISEKP